MKTTHIFFATRTLRNTAAKEQNAKRIDFGKDSEYGKRWAIEVEVVKTPEKKPFISKQQLAFEIYANHPFYRRRTIIQMFVEQLGMSMKGASTYYQNAKRAYNT